MRFEKIKQKMTTLFVMITGLLFQTRAVFASNNIGDGGFLDSTSSGINDLVSAFIKYTDVVILPVVIAGILLAKVIYSKNDKMQPVLTSALKIAIVAGIALNLVFGIVATVIWAAGLLGA